MPVIAVGKQGWRGARANEKRKMEEGDSRSQANLDAHVTSYQVRPHADNLGQRHTSNRVPRVIPTRLHCLSSRLWRCSSGLLSSIASRNCPNPVTNRKCDPSVLATN